MTKRKARLTKAERQQREGERLAAMLVAAEPEGDHMLAPPAYITDPRLKPALVVWRELAPIVYQRVMLDGTDRYMFALFCFYQAEFIALHDEVMDKGRVIHVRTVSGDLMPRKNPAVDLRKHAADRMIELSEHFGLSPLDRAKLFRAQKDDPQAPIFPRLDRRGADKPDDDQPPAASTDSWSALLDDKRLAN